MDLLTTKNAEKNAQEMAELASKEGTGLSVVKEDSALQGKIYFEVQQYVLKDMPDAKAVESHLTSVLKTDAVVVELFAKSLSKIAGNVISYMKQRQKSKERADEKKKELQKQEVQKVKEHARNAAAKVKQLKGLAHPTFGVDQKCWHPFKVNDGKDFKVDDCFDSPWILRASESAKAWRNHAEVTVKLSEFGGAYKQAPSFRVDGRTGRRVAKTWPRSC